MTRELLLRLTHTLTEGKKTLKTEQGRKEGGTLWSSQTQKMQNILLPAEHTYAKPFDFYWQIKTSCLHKKNRPLCNVLYCLLFSLFWTKIYNIIYKFRFQEKHVVFAENFKTPACIRFLTKGWSMWTCSNSSQKQWLCLSTNLINSRKAEVIWFNLVVKDNFWV